MVLREKEQEDLVGLFTKAFDGIQTAENIKIRTDYVIVDRNGIDASFNDCT